MVKRVHWDIFEAVLLADAYFMIEKGYLERKIAVQMISEELRQKAINAKMDIDDVFRNIAGINMHLYGIQYIATEGKCGMRNTSQLFIQVVYIYRNFPNYFNILLRKAKSLIDNGSSCRGESFFSWLEHSEYIDSQEEIELAYRIVSMFARNKHLINYNLQEVTNAEEIEEIQKVVYNSAHEQKIKLEYKFNSLFKAYLAYLALETIEKRNEIVDRRAVNVDVKFRFFFEWLIDKRGLTTATAQYYSSVIDVMESYAKQIYGKHKSIHEIDSIDEIEQLFNEIVADNCFIQVDLQSQNLFSEAFENYIQYMRIFIEEKSHETIIKNSNEKSFLYDMEEIIRKADIDGITVRNISDKTGKSIWLIKKYLRAQEYAIEIPGNVYVHVDNVVDIYENKEKIKKIIENQFAKFAGYTNDEVLFDAASITLGMFLNDNFIDKPEKIYGITRFLFEKNEKVYYFAGDKHIWKDSPQYTTTYAGVLLGYISSNGGKASKTQCIEYLQRVKLPANNVNSILSIATNKQVLFYGNEEYVLADYVIKDELYLERIKIQIEKLFSQALYVVPREISDNWFELLPNLDGGMSWNLLLLQDIIKKYLPEYRLITANENQRLETIRAGIVPQDSFIENFADLVYIRILEDATVSLPIRIDKEDFRKKLIEYKMIQGNELIYTMPKAVASSKFAWTSEGDSVLILKE